jgi:hypothetical protein
MAVAAARVATEMPPSAPISPLSRTTWIGEAATAIRPTPMPMQTIERWIIALRPYRSPSAAQNGPVIAVSSGETLIARPSQSPVWAPSPPATSRIRPGSDGITTMKPTEARKPARLSARRFRRRPASALAAPRPTEKAETMRCTGGTPTLPSRGPQKKGRLNPG